METATLKQLRLLIACEVHRVRAKQRLNEAVGPKERGEDSLDTQVDKFFAEYEGDSRPKIPEARRKRGRVIAEAGDAPPPAGNVPPKLADDKIDISAFTGSVVRLIENYDALLEVRNTILRRAANFLAKGYDTDIVSEFKESLREEHGIVIGKSSRDVSDEEYAAPPMARSGPDGGGAA